MTGEEQNGLGVPLWGSSRKRVSTGDRELKNRRNTLSLVKEETREKTHGE